MLSCGASKQAELCNQYLKKGSQAYVEGKLETRSWDDKDGTKKYTTEIKGSMVQFIGEKTSQDTTTQQPQNNQTLPTPQPQTNPNFATDDIPF